MEQEQNWMLSRIERLETENRRIKRAAAAFLVAVATIGLMGQTTTTRKSRPQRLRQPRRYCPKI